MPKHMETREKHIQKHMFYTDFTAKTGISLRSAVSTWNHSKIRREYIKVVFGRANFSKVCRKLSLRRRKASPLTFFIAANCHLIWPIYVTPVRPSNKVQYGPYDPPLCMLLYTEPATTSDKIDYVNFGVSYIRHNEPYDPGMCTIVCDVDCHSVC